MYVRQIDVEGVDAKFVERYQRLFSYLLPLALPANRLEVPSPGLDFSRQFGSPGLFTRGTASLTPSCPFSLGV
jgi:hypothetical protein